jgi:5-dehydro-2-deoxygluconokinase
MLERLRANSFLVIGRAGLDLYADPPGTPMEDARGFTAALGGSAANIAVAIARQGGRAALMTVVSNDAVGRFTRKALASYGVDASLVGDTGGEARNSLAVVETRAVDCQSVIYRNGAADFMLGKDVVSAVDYARFGAVIVTGTCLAREPSRSATLDAMRRAKAAGAVLVMDVDYRPYSWTSGKEAQRRCKQAAAMCDIVVGNDEEFDVLAGAGLGRDHAAAMTRRGACIAIYKMGPEGCIAFTKDGSFETPVYAVAALKPTGAGDAFMGGMLSGLAKGESLENAVRRGAATAAIVVTRVGCAPAMPDAAEVSAFMQAAAG